MFSVQKKILDLEIVLLDHSLRSIKVCASENYCVTFCNDGIYNLYEFDDDRRWNKVVMVNCCHWQTGGLAAARVDSEARNILTLSGEGNFMCTSFKYVFGTQVIYEKYYLTELISVTPVRISDNDPIRLKSQ